MSSFKNLRIVDNFYQTSAFFPMPTVLISTLTADGKTTLGPYSLVAPYYIAGKDYYAMLLCARTRRTRRRICCAMGSVRSTLSPMTAAILRRRCAWAFRGTRPRRK